MNPTDKAAARINRDFVALNFRLAVAASKLHTSASIVMAAAMHDFGAQALADARSANRLARLAIAALS